MNTRETALQTILRAAELVDETGQLVVGFDAKNSDARDFMSISRWKLQGMLEAAFDAGARPAATPPRRKRTYRGDPAAEGIAAARADAQHGYHMTREQAEALAIQLGAERAKYIAKPYPDRHGDFANGYQPRPDTWGVWDSIGEHWMCRP